MYIDYQIWSALRHWSAIWLDLLESLDCHLQWGLIQRWVVVSEPLPVPVIGEQIKWCIRCCEVAGHGPLSLPADWETGFVCRSDWSAKVEEISSGNPVQEISNDAIPAHWSCWNAPVFPPSLACEGIGFAWLDIQRCWKVFTFWVDRLNDHGFIGLEWNMLACRQALAYFCRLCGWGHGHGPGWGDHDQESQQECSGVSHAVHRYKLV